VNLSDARPVIICFAIVVLALAGFVEYRCPVFLESLDLRGYDHLVRVRGPRDPDPRIVLVGIDKNSFDKLKKDREFSACSKWPWPNSLHARLVRNLNRFGAKVIALDLLSMSELSREKYRDEDLELARAFAETGSVVLAEMYEFTRFEKNGAGAANAEGARLAVGTGSSEEDDAQRSGGTQNWTLPHRMFRNITERAFANYPADNDEFIRRFSPSIKRQKRFDEWAFPLVIALKYLGYGTNEIHLEEKQVVTPAFTIPLVGGSALIRFDGQGARTGNGYISYYDALKATSETELPISVRGKIALVGPFYPDSHDFFPTPFYAADAQKSYGVEIHRCAISTILSNAYAEPASSAARVADMLFFASVLAVSALLVDPLFSLLAFLVACGCQYMLSRLLFVYIGYILPYASIISLGACVYLAFLSLKIFVMDRNKRLVRNMFQTYVSPELLTHIENNPGSFKLAGERRTATMFFSDLAGFTTMSEKLDPELLATVLNRYLTPMTEIIQKHRGFIDKYEGDAIMADFGVPLEDADHARNCCLAALEQQESMKRLNVELEKEIGLTFAIRMGINTGVVSAGNMGSDSRFQYTVMGDAVNLASRLEGANKFYGSSVLAAEGTYELVKELFEFRSLDLLVVKGKTMPVAVYELVGLKGCVEKVKLELIAKFTLALEHYRAGRFADALHGFEVALSLDPDDAPTKVYIERARKYIAEPPLGTWRGESVLTAK
jgi:adenylate cyclase